MLIITAFLLAACTAGGGESSSVEGNSSVMDEESSLIDSASSATDDASSAVGTSSEPKDPVTTAEIDKSAYEYKAIYTDKRRLDGVFPFGFYLDSYEELADYNKGDEEAGLAREDFYKLDQSVGKVPSYRTWVKKYDRDYFEENGLLVLVVQAEKGIVPKVDALYKRSDGYIDAHVDGCGYTEKEQQLYHIFIEIPKAEMGENKLEVNVCDITDE